MHVIGEYPSEEGLEFLGGTEQPSTYSKICLVWLQLSQGTQSDSWRLSSSPARIVHCAAGEDFFDSSSITSNHGDDSQNSLATIIIQLLSKKSLPIHMQKACVLLFI